MKMKKRETIDLRLSYLKILIRNGKELFEFNQFSKVLPLLFFMLFFIACQKELLEDQVIDVNKSPAALKEASVSNSIKVMSFNIRHDDSSDPQTLDERKENILQVILDEDPEIVGVQELKDGWMEIWLPTQMALYGYSVFSTLTYAYGSPKAIFYKSNRFTLQESSGFSISYSDENRSGHWVKLRDNNTNLRYFVCNSHWSTTSSFVRNGMATLLKEEIEENYDGLPLIVFGDFNAQPGTIEISTIKRTASGLVCTHNETGNTFHGWDAIGDGKNDWILCTRDLAFINKTIVKTAYDGYWPSDHWPITATFTPAIFDAANYDVHGLSSVATTKFYFADVTGDGKDDKIFWRPNFDKGCPRIYESNGDGTFTYKTSHTASSSELSTTYYYFADVNGDGMADLIKWDLTQESGRTIVYLATGGGNFSQTPVIHTAGTSQNINTTFYFADITGDGMADKIYWNPTFDGGKTRVYIAIGNGYFSKTVISNTEGYSQSKNTTFYFADVTGDGLADKIYWNPTYDGGRTRVYVATGKGYFSSTVVSCDNGYSSSTETSYYFADVNGDNRADRIFWKPTANLGKLKVYFSNGSSATFDDPIFSLRGTSQSADTRFFFADIDGDGQADQIRWNYSETPDGYSKGTLKNYFAN